MPRGQGGGEVGGRTNGDEDVKERRNQRNISKRQVFHESAEEGLSGALVSAGAIATVARVLT